MSERTFRAIVAAVLVGALALAVAVVAVLLPRPTQPSPGPSITESPTSSPTSSPTPTAFVGPALVAPGVVSVGLIPRGANSGQTLVLQFIEPSVDAIPNAPGSFRLTVADAAGDGSTVAFVGTPSVGAPGSLGTTVTVVAPNVLMISIQASDTLNVEPITIRGLGIDATSTAALGSLRLRLSDFTGSLAGGIANDTVPSPGTVVPGP